MRYTFSNDGDVENRRVMRCAHNSALPAPSIIPAGAHDNIKEFDDFTLPPGKLNDARMRSWARGSSMAQICSF